MHKKSVIFGIGIGIMAMVLVSLGAYALQRAAHRREVVRIIDEANEVVEEVLRQYELLFPQEEHDIP